MFAIVSWLCMVGAEHFPIEFLVGVEHLPIEFERLISLLKYGWCVYLIRFCIPPLLPLLVFFFELFYVLAGGLVLYDCCCFFV